MVPPAPSLFSITIVWPNVLPMLTPEGAGDHVGRAACGKGDDEGDRLCGVGLRRYIGRREGGEDGDERRGEAYGKR